MTDFGSPPEGLLEGLAMSIDAGQIRTRDTHCLKKSELKTCRQFFPRITIADNFRFGSLVKACSDFPLVRNMYARKRLSAICTKLRYMASKGVFPKSSPTAYGGRPVGWLRSEIDSWILIQREAGSLEKSSQWRG
jgi:hypothetical protein